MVKKAGEMYQKLAVWASTKAEWRESTALDRLAIIVACLTIFGTFSKNSCD